LGAIGSDVLTVASATGAFADKNVGVGKTVNISFTLGGVDAGNYSQSGTTATTQAAISVRPLSHWLGTTGNWSDATNWDALPDGSNVLDVTIPSGASVRYDAGVGPTQLQSLSSSGALILADGSLNVSGAITTPQYAQTGGVLAGAGGLTVNGRFSQTGGKMALTGSIAINQTSGNIDVTNVGAIDIKGLNAGNGNIRFFNTGGISTSGAVVADNGSVSMTANSPLTIGSGGVIASGNIELIATNLTSAGNLTLNGPIRSSAGAVTLFAANNLVQNGLVSAAGGVTSTAGGSLTFGEAANTVGSPLSYSANGLPVIPHQLLQSTATPDLLVSFSTQFEAAVRAQDFIETKAVLSTSTTNPSQAEVKDFETDPLKPHKKNKDDVVVEGQTCKP
jgi:hypothetical protein